jgi:hypothetical protein
MSFLVWLVRGGGGEKVKEGNTKARKEGNRKGRKEGNLEVHEAKVHDVAGL